VPNPGDVVPYPPYPAAGAAAQGGLQYSLEATQLLVKAVLESVVARLPPALAADQSLKVTLQNSIVAAISGNVAVTNMIPAVETGLAKEATLGQIKVLAEAIATEATLGQLKVVAESIAKEATQGLIKAKTDNLDISLSALRDALKGGKTLADIWTSLQTQREISTSLWTDDSGAKYVRRDVVDESAGSITISWTDESGNVAVPGAGLRPLASTDKEVVESLFTATGAGAGYGAGDILARVLIVDTSVAPPALTSTWMNVTTGAVIAAPGAGTVDQFVGLTDQELRATPVPTEGPAAAGAAVSGKPFAIAGVTAGGLVERILSAGGHPLVRPYGQTMTHADGKALAQRVLADHAGTTMGIPGAALYGFNGATLDLLRATLANGLLADVSRVQAMPVSAAGNVTAQTPRFTLATDDAAIAALISELRDKYGYYFNLGQIKHVGAAITSGLGSTQSFRLANPAGSGKTLLLLHTMLATTVDATFTFNKNGTLAGPTSHTPWDPNFVTNAGAGVAQAQSLVGAITGGTALAGSQLIAANIPLSLPFLVLLPEGTAMLATTTFGTGATTHVNVMYAEF